MSLKNEPAVLGKRVADEFYVFILRIDQFYLDAVRQLREIAAKDKFVAVLSFQKEIPYGCRTDDSQGSDNDVTFHIDK